MAKKVYLRDEEFEDAEIYRGDYRTTRVVLEDDEMSDFTDYIALTDRPHEALAELLTGGYKLSISYSGKTGSYFVSLSCSKQALCNAGKTLTIECLDIEKGQYALAYVHYSRYREVWPTGGDRKLPRF